MKKMLIAVCMSVALSACQSGVNFEFSTSQDNTECLKENPSQNCHPVKD